MIFARDLARKTVLLSDGTVIGTLYNITINPRTGELVDLLVKPSKSAESIPGLVKQNNLFIIPFESVESISDCIVLDKRKIKKF